jgi:hypothetical protein
VPCTYASDEAVRRALGCPPTDRLSQLDSLARAQAALHAAGHAVDPAALLAGAAQHALCLQLLRFSRDVRREQWQQSAVLALMGARAPPARAVLLLPFFICFVASLTQPCATTPSLSSVRL